MFFFFNRHVMWCCLQNDSLSCIIVILSTITFLQKRKVLCQNGKLPCYQIKHDKVRMTCCIVFVCDPVPVAKKNEDKCSSYHFSQGMELQFQKQSHSHRKM